MNRITSLAGITLLLCAAVVVGQQPPPPPAAAPAPAPQQPADRDAYQKALRTADPMERVKALEQFVKDYPSSMLVRNAHQSMFNLLLSASQKALEHADKAIEATPEAERAGVYNSIAWPLAEQGVQLERASDYIKKGVDQAREKKVNTRTLAMYLDTQALIQYKLGDYAAAEKTQREAYGYLPTTADALMQTMDFRTRLGMILVKSGKHAEAADLLATSLLFGEPKGAAKAFDEAIAAMGADAAAKKAELFKKAGEQYIATAPTKESAQARVAVGYARNRVLGEEAVALARQAVEALGPKVATETVIEAHRGMGLVYSHQGNHAGATEHLGKIAKVISPFDADTHARLGQALEAQGKNDEALGVYLNAATVGSNPRVMEPLTALYKKVHGSDAGLKERIAKMSEEAVNFKPSGPAKGTRSGRAVLAELFTGSECPPCVASDLAFDHVLAAYDRKAAIVLEYHIHIPGPDPMTNDDTEARKSYYGVNSTPSVFVGGSERIGGGGPKPAAKNRFDLYSTMIDRKLDEQPAATIELDGSVKGTVLTVRASAKTGAPGNLKLRIALVEETLHFTGANGLSEHRAVVRKLIGSPAGIALAAGKAAHSETIELAAVTADLKRYLDNWEKSPPGNFASMKTFSWKEKKHEINPGNLSLVAFVQDDATKDVLQASFFKLPSAPRGSTSGRGEQP